MVERIEKTLLVTGATGYIGSHTIVELLENNTQNFTKIVIIDNLENSSTKVLDKIGEITKKTPGEDFHFENCDIRDKPRLEEVFKKYAPVHSVIHFAGLKAVGVSVSQPLTYYDNNVGGTIALL
jgi:UDP-glucose 4-epimerase